MDKRKLWVVSALIGASAGLGVAGRLRAQDQAPAQHPAAQEKTGGSEKAEAKQPPAKVKAGTKGAVEARLKAAEKAKPAEKGGPIQEVERTLFATRQFEQAAISPDGNRVAWVEKLIGKDGAPIRPAS